MHNLAPASDAKAYLPTESVDAKSSDVHDDLFKIKWCFGFYIPCLWCWTEASWILAKVAVGGLTVCHSSLAQKYAEWHKV